ncbi:hypothetical protein AB0901_21625 [Streptomyces roseifaciens]
MPGYEGIPDIRSAYEDERRGGGRSYRVASDAVLSRCRQNIGKQVTVRFDSSWHITRIEPVT